MPRVVAAFVVRVPPPLQVLLDRRAQHATLCGLLVTPRGDVVPRGAALAKSWEAK